MFDHLSNNLKKMKNGQKVAINIPLDDKGYFDRKCPNPECAKIFKVHFDDWKNIVKDEVVYCPICKTENPSSEWNTLEQQDYIKSQALDFIQNTIGSAIKKDVSEYNSKQKPGFISISLSYKPGKKILPLPPFVAKELEQSYMCDQCQCRYSYLGTAYFCPSCGNENVQGNISEGIRNIENFINHNEKIKEALKEVLSIEDAESYFNQIIEEHYCKIVALLQKYSEYLFSKLPNSTNIKIRKNIFQNIDDSSQKWKELTGKGYDDIVEQTIFDNIKEHFQVRHLLSHTGGIIDEDFIKKTNNKSYVIGRRINIYINNLFDFLSNIKILMKKMYEEYK